MKASQFSDAQKAFILKQGDEGVTVAEICRKAGISQATYFNWKKNTRHVAAGDEEAEAARGRECTAEEDCRGSDVGPRDVAGRHSPKALRPARKREMVKGMCQDWAISIRRACGALDFDRSTHHYISRRAIRPVLSVVSVRSA